MRRVIVGAVMLALGATGALAQQKVVPWVELSGGVGASSTDLGVAGLPEIAGQGMLGGVGAGVDTQLSWGSVGIMARYSLMNIDGTVIGPVALKAQGLWEVAARLGVNPNPHVKLYGLVGWSGQDLDVTTLGGGGHPNGLMLGGGVDTHLTGNWVARLEYTWHDFKRDQLFGPIGAETDLHVVRVGLVYQFGGQSIFDDRPVAPSIRGCDPKRGNC